VAVPNGKCVKGGGNTVGLNNKEGQKQEKNKRGNSFPPLIKCRWPRNKRKPGGRGGMGPWGGKNHWVGCGHTKPPRTRGEKGSSGRGRKTAPSCKRESDAQKNFHSKFQVRRAVWVKRNGPVQGKRGDKNTHAERDTLVKP